MPDKYVTDLTRSLRNYTDRGDSAQEALTRASVGFTGKNKAYSQTNNAVIAHIENGKPYKVSWVGSATITLKKDSSSGTQVATGDTSPLSFTADSDFDLYFGSSDDVTNIMVYDARIKDSTFEPYHESVEVEVEEELYGVNLFSNSLSGIATAGGSVGATTFGITAGATSFYGRVEHNKDYMITKVGGDRFRVCLSNDVPANGVACEIIANASGYSYSFNSGNYNYAFLLANITAATVDEIKPMLYKSELGSNLPYHSYNPQSIQNQINDKGVLGAKNLLENTATTRTLGSITFTVNNDTTITINGTDTTDRWLTVNGAVTLKPNNYFISVEGSTRSGELWFALAGQSAGTDIPERGYSLSVSEQTTYKFMIHIRANEAYSNKTLKPMIRLASDPDDTYVPYAMTNKELTDNKVDKITGVLSNVDLNNVTETGNYRLDGTITNGVGNYGFLIVIGDSRAVRQIYTSFSGAIQGNVYTRLYDSNNAAWTSWYKFEGTVAS